MKYPLTDKAMEGARQLAENWTRGTLEQHMVWRTTSEGGDADLVQLSRSGVLERGGYPKSGVLLELARFGLITVTINRSTDGRTHSVDIVLLQELRNAVKTDFEVSDYFLTMNSVGTIVQGNLTIQPGGMMQSAATNIGNIYQTVEQLADDLIRQLGAQFLENNAELKQSIEDLRTATEVDKPSKFGGLVLQLGRCLQHGANTAGVITGISMVVHYLSQFPI